jgi:hypothetical protein
LLVFFWDEVAVAGDRTKRNYWRINRWLFKSGSGANEEAEIRVNAHFCQYDPEQYDVKYGSLKSVFAAGGFPNAWAVSIEPPVRCCSVAEQAVSKAVAGIMCLPGMTVTEHAVPHGRICSEARSGFPSFPHGKGNND